MKLSGICLMTVQFYVSVSWTENSELVYLMDLDVDGTNSNVSEAFANIYHFPGRKTGGMVKSTSTHQKGYIS